VGGSPMKEEQGKLPWSKPTLVAVPGENYDRTSLRAFDPQTARTAKRFCRLADVTRLGMAINGGNGQR
jgi:hypothetical protein